MGLPRSQAINDRILTIVDRATKMVYIASVQQTIIAAEADGLYWDRIGKSHGIPRSIISD